jgi:hypothetical protein
MNDFTEPTKIVNGTDTVLHEMPIVSSEDYDYTNLFTISESKNRFGDPNLDQLGSLLCKHCEIISHLRQKSNIGYYANIVRPVDYYNSIDMEDVEFINNIIHHSDIKHGSHIDFLLSSPGGYIHPSQKLIENVNQNYKCSYLILESAYSAATMIALGGVEIILQQFGHLAPANPRINDYDTYIAKKIYRTHKLQKIFCPWAAPSLPEAKVAENRVTYRTLLDLEKLAYTLVNKSLCNLFGIKKWTWHLKTRFKINKITKFFTDYSKHNSHLTPFYAKSLDEIGLPFKMADDKLDTQLFIINNICKEITTTKWQNYSGSFYIRKIYFSAKGWYVLKHIVELK